MADDITDGYGSWWSKCDLPDCDLHVVRPGDARCDASSCELGRQWMSDIDTQTPDETSDIRRQHSDIAQELCDWAYIIEESQGKATVLMLGGSVFDEAAAEIERLREQLEFAHNILGSETMVWLFHGSDGWKQSNIDHLRKPVHLYWERYGNVFKEANREQ